jgi:hypothetical protein
MILDSLLLKSYLTMLLMRGRDWRLVGSEELLCIAKPDSMDAAVMSHILIDDLDALESDLGSRLSS